MITFVSSGLLKPKKRYHGELGRRHLYLNYGCLGLATILRRAGKYDARVLHGGFEDPECFAERIASELDGRHTLFLSLPSFQSVAWASRFCARVRVLRPSLSIALGGRWVVDGNGQWIRSRIPYVDLIVYGTAEERILALAEPRNWSRVPGTDRYRPNYREKAGQLAPSLDFRAVEGFEAFQPSIEASRGCGMGCVFCPERAVPLTRLRSASEIIRMVEDAVLIYEAEEINPYLESSFFVPPRRWAEDLEHRYSRSGLRIEWRCETRVDAISERVLPHLAAAGLKVLDLGLESASPRQLLAMGKTRDPERYLTRASQLLEQARGLGIWVKVNYLVYPGEDRTSIEESKEWLSRHSDSIKGVSCGLLTAYGPTSETRQFVNSLRPLGARPTDEDALTRDGYVELHPSETIDADEARALCIELSRTLMDDRDYFDLKAFSYFPRSFSFDDFRKIVDRSADEELPFRQSSPRYRWEYAAADPDHDLGAIDFR